MGDVCSDTRRAGSKNMKSQLLLSCALGLLIAAGCSGEHSGFDQDAGGSAKDGAPEIDQFVPLPSGDSGSFGDASSPDGGSGGVTTIYAHSDTTLYTLNPQTNAVTLVGTFAGTSGGTNDTTVTDLAVNSTGDVYVNSESVIYKATVPTSPGTVQLTKIALDLAPVGPEVLRARIHAGRLARYERGPRRRRRLRRALFD